MHEDPSWTAEAHEHPRAPSFVYLYTEQCQGLTYLEEIYARLLNALASNIM